MFVVSTGEINCHDHAVITHTVEWPRLLPKSDDQTLGECSFPDLCRLQLRTPALEKVQSPLQRDLAYNAAAKNYYG